MRDLHLDALIAALDALPARYPGPGGVAGVMRNGQTIAARAWGHANLDTGQAMTVETRLPVCSISKQFTCQVLLAEVGDPARLDPRVAAFLPNFTGVPPTVRQLCDNQSGLRDYWALTVLQGARAEQVFARDDAFAMFARMKTGHFEPGTQYSYSNGNFRILSELLEGETGQTLEALYRRHVWGPAGMTQTMLASDTRTPLDGVAGYEGSDATGHLPAQNGIFWIGDAGIAASLADMLAYEAWIDATRDDPDSLYRRISVPPRFADGAPARYGFGLAHERLADVPFTGHGGALRGFRARRMHARGERLSVVVMFNHEGDAHGAAEGLARAALGIAQTKPMPIPDGWDGQWIGPDGLLTRIATGRTSATLAHATGADVLTLAADGSLAAPDVTVERQQDGLRMRRFDDNTDAVLVPLPVIEVADGPELAGRYIAEELGAEVLIVAAGGGVRACFSGLLGTGRMERVAPAGRDVWTVATRRSMDAPAPGDWTLVVRRDDTGRISGFTLGCWLARGLEYRRV